MDTRILLDTLPKDVLQDTCIAVLHVHARKLQHFCNTYVQYCWKGCIHGYCIRTGSIHVAPGRQGSTDSDGLRRTGSGQGGPVARDVPSEWVHVGGGLQRARARGDATGLTA